jgi:hypothetical protein
MMSLYITIIVRFILAIGFGSIHSVEAREGEKYNTKINSYIKHANVFHIFILLLVAMECNKHVLI